MSLQILALLIVTVGFSALLWRVLSPRNKAHYEALGRIPLEDADTSKDKEQAAKE